MHKTLATALAAILFSLMIGKTALALDQTSARHLLSRTGFGAAPAEIARLARLDHPASVRQILDGVRTTPVTAPPEFVTQPRPDWAAYYQSRDESRRQEFQRLRRLEQADLRAWWLGEMLATPSPLTERMVLFWHNHFVSAADKVTAADLMWRQNQTFRQHALGDYRQLLRAMVADPAMLRYLDGAQSPRQAPNENFAREFFELFTLGEGQYSEDDIREAARAFTGWRVSEASGQARFERNGHDDGVKTILGRTGPWMAEDVVDLVLARPRAAEFIVAKLWQEFVSPTPDPAELRRISALFRDSRYNLRVALQALLTTPTFTNPNNRGTLIKSPVDLMVGAARSFELNAGQTRALGEALRRMGQNLMTPPNVRGWPGGETWITTQTLVERRNGLASLLAGRFETPSDAEHFTSGARALDPFVASHRPLIENAAALQALLLATAPTSPMPSDLRARIDALVFDPGFHLR